jgi:hypothetical protein
MTFKLREVIAFNFAKDLSARLGYDFDETPLRRIARYADSLILSGTTAPPAFAEAIELELLGVIDDSGIALPVASAPPVAPPQL